MTGWLLLALLIALFLPLLLVMGLFAWHQLNTRGMAYFGRAESERALFRRRLARYGRLVIAVLRPFRAAFADPNRFAARLHGLYVPQNTCSEKSLEQALRYEPQAGDVFVVTQMKCGTTWMQQLLYELLQGGEGDLSDAGHGHMAAVSPWLESYNGVAMAEAPLLGPGGRRIIKTHLPASHCPYSAAAKYVYVTRHPVSCYRSIGDFFATMGGPMTPPAEALLRWYCSDEMWWGSWPAHVDGYWRWAQERDNVQFFHFEEMRRDLPGVARRLAAFLEIALDEAQLARVVEKAGFDYMKAHEAQFEMMVPPNFFSVGDSFFKSGSAQRHKEATAAEKAHINAFCRERLAGSGYPLQRFYADVAAGY